MSKIAIVGLGLMGASLAMAIREARPDADLVGIDLDRRTLAKAREGGLVNEASHELAAVRGSDLVFVAVPLPAMRELFAALKPYAGSSALTDLASTKTITLNCFDQTDDSSGPKLSRPNAVTHHHMGESRPRVRCSTTPTPPHHNAMFSAVTRSAAVRTLTTRLRSAIAAPSNGVPIHESRCSGCPVFQASCPAL